MFLFLDLMLAIIVNLIEIGLFVFVLNSLRFCDRFHCVLSSLIKFHFVWISDAY